MVISTIERSQLGIMLIDVQPTFWKYAFGNNSDLKEAVMLRIEHLLMLADWMDLPLITTFEHPIEKHGQLPDRLEKVFPENGQRFTKHTYNCCSEPMIREAITRLSVQQFAIAGAETDVCILQSVLGLLKMEYQVFILEDCLFTSEPHPGPSLRRMYQAGAIPSTLKSLAYELTKSVDHTPWMTTWIKPDLEHHKQFPKKFRQPEDFPKWDPKL